MGGNKRALSYDNPNGHGYTIPFMGKEKYKKTSTLTLVRIKDLAGKDVSHLNLFREDLKSATQNLHDVQNVEHILYSDDTPRKFSVEVTGYHTIPTMNGFFEVGITNIRPLS